MGREERGRGEGGNREGGKEGGIKRSKVVLEGKQREDMPDACREENRVVIVCHNAAAP